MKGRACGSDADVLVPFVKPLTSALSLASDCALSDITAALQDLANVGGGLPQSMLQVRSQIERVIFRSVPVKSPKETMDLTFGLSTMTHWNGQLHRQEEDRFVRTAWWMDEAQQTTGASPFGINTNKGQVFMVRVSVYLYVPARCHFYALLA
jgi:hypothetical protein